MLKPFKSTLKHLASYSYSNSHAAIAILVSRGQILFSRRGVITCSISALRKKGLVLFTGLTGTETTTMVGSIN